MNANHIRLLAIFTMVIDHIGIFIFPQHFFLRVIGRLSFPLFAWLIANGAEYTKNSKQYLLRIGAMALVSQAPYLLAFKLTDPAFDGWNIFLTLFLGLATVLVFKKTTNHFIRYLSALALSLIAIILNASYGAAGVMAVLVCYVFRRNMHLMTLAQMIVFAFFYVIPDGYIAYSIGQSILSITPLYLYQPFGALALLLTVIYTHKNGRDMKYFFYFFYPVHLLILYALNRVLL